MKPTTSTLEETNPLPGLANRLPASPVAPFPFDLHPCTGACACPIFEYSLEYLVEPLPVAERTAVAPGGRGGWKLVFVEFEWTMYWYASSVETMHLVSVIVPQQQTVRRTCWRTFDNHACGAVGRESGRPLRDVIHVEAAFSCNLSTDRTKPQDVFDEDTVVGSYQSVDLFERWQDNAALLPLLEMRKQQDWLRDLQWQEIWDGSSKSTYTGCGSPHTVKHPATPPRVVVRVVSSWNAEPWTLMRA